MLELHSDQHAVHGLWASGLERRGRFVNSKREFSIDVDWWLNRPTLCTYDLRCVSGYVWTLVSVYFCICWRHSIRTSLFPREIWLILWDVRILIGRSYTIRIRYVWTQMFLYPHKKICGYKNLRIRMDGALQKIPFSDYLYLISLL